VKKGPGCGIDRILIPESDDAGWPWVPLAHITSLPFAKGVGRGSRAQGERGGAGRAGGADGGGGRSSGQEMKGVVWGDRKI